jgi:hypothetical protein
VWGGASRSWAPIPSKTPQIVRGFRVLPGQLGRVARSIRDARPLHSGLIAGNRISSVARPPLQQGRRVVAARERVPLSVQGDADQRKRLGDPSGRT